MNYKSLSRKKEYYTRVGWVFFLPSLQIINTSGGIYLYMCACVFTFLKNERRFMKYKAKV